MTEGPAAGVPQGWGTTDAPPRFPGTSDSILEAVGWTPLIRIRRMARGIRTPIFGKAEYLNPGGSVKDRIGFAIIEAAEREGRLKPGGTIVEGTSGNTGVGLAIAAAIKGYKTVFTIPDKMSQEKVRLLKAFGAEVIVTPTAVPVDHPDYYVMVAKRIAETTPNAILADQFYNQANPEAHYATTGPEIWTQTGGRVTHLVASPGTGGTISGTAKYLKERDPAIRVVAGDPEGSLLAEYHRTGDLGQGHPYKVEGIGNDKIPSTLWVDFIDEFRTVDDRTAFLTARRLTREEGLFVGGSAGLIAHVALEVAREVDDPDACVVFLLCDTGERYLSKSYNDEWMRENRMLPPEASTTAADLVASREESAPGALVAAEPGTPVRRALALLSENHISQLPVLEGGDCVGSVSEAALMAGVISDPAAIDRGVESLMEPPFPVVDAGSTPDALAPLLTRGNAAVLVRRDGAIDGIITRHDMVRHLTGR